MNVAGDLSPPPGRGGTAGERATEEDSAAALLDELRRIRRLLAAGQAEFLDAHGVARLLTLSRASIYRLVAAGKLPRPYRLNGAAQWKRAELLAVLDNLVV